MVLCMRCVRQPHSYVDDLTARREILRGLELYFLEMFGSKDISLRQVGWLGVTRQ